MQNRSIRTLPSWLSWLFVVIFLAHLSAVVIYEFGKETMPYPVVKLADRYVVPWFFQNYKMFAPDPTDQIHSFLYRVKEDGEWSAWHQPVYQYQQGHWANRLGNSGDMYRIVNWMGTNLFVGAQAVHLQEEATDSLWFELPAYKTAERYVMRLSPYADSGDVEALQVGVMTEHHRVQDGEIRSFTLFQPYPVKSFEP
jgi:hypothetical protein